MNHKNNRRCFAALAATTLVLSSGLLVAGCGSGGKNSSPSANATVDPSGALRDVQTGQIALNGLLTQTATPTASDLQTVSASFASAHAKDPNNAEASVMLGLMQVSAAAEDVATALAPSGRAVPGGLPDLRLRSLPALKNGLVSARRVRVRSILTGPLLFPGKNGGSGRAAVDSAKVRTSLQNLQNAITNALPLIQKGADKSDFGFAFADFETNTGSVRVLDQADVTVIIAALYDTRAALNVGLAYNTDTNGFDFAQTVGDRFAAKNVGDTVSPDEYLPAAPFGTLLSSGKTNFAQAKSDVLTGADATQTALTRLQNRSTSALHLIDSADITAAQYAEAGLVLVGVKSSLAGPITLPLGSLVGGANPNTSVTINLKAWFDNPPQNIRAFLPTYTVGTDGSGAKSLLASAASYPDKTFGGLIPNATGLDSLFDAAIPGDQSLSDLLTGFLSGLGSGSGS